ncbi:alpha-L-rhamnosidase [Fimbriimonas ginsengisoli]|uniref:alpha-L-rhamnosidase n=1 Tax=Fimbriimonas ginsengisoli Gsoil 348 TaxID=661478 RepID=A0A068NXC3_FIMGI|nr:alpha-L-rhamnosidase [Fimbriimonas ginsengisoli]AIE86284.1 alpha-L-rhamnosidase [Fimbriimonas ginsengisoli Gsoil 348]
MTPVRLRTEYRENPLGLDIAIPRLFWQLQSDRNGARQTAYQIQAGTSPGAADLWDSGKVESSTSIHIPYEGASVGSLSRIWWRVQVWDEAGEASGWSEPSFWETGLPPEEWSSRWIQDLPMGGPRTTGPAPFLRTEIQLEKPVKEARLVATALGLYEFRINGERVGDDYFAPGWTDYNKRVQYQVYDVTGLVQTGANALGAILGDGWYCGHVEWRGRQLYGDRPKLRAQLLVRYEDGSEEVFGTDASWRASFGPILESDMLMGESYDARRELGGWDRPEYHDDGWRAVEEVDLQANLVGMVGPTVKSTQELEPVDEPKEMAKWPRPDFLFDLGQNMVGRVRLRVKGEAGKTVRLRFGEILDEKGHLYTDNLRSAKQTDNYTLKGDPEGEVWESRFTFHGFRYVELGGDVEKPGRDAITGIVMHSDTPKTGDFVCSDELVNQLQRNIDWGQRGNFVDIPTDCPQRDERLGWTGDAQVFVRTAAFNRDVAGFFTKWQNDLKDSQSEIGEIPPTAPNTNAVGADGGPAWADAVMICPWTIYLCYGDKALLAEHYDSMKEYVDFLEKDSHDLIRSHPDKKGFHGFGDWLSTKAETPNDLIGTAFLVYSSRLMAKIAGVLGHGDDVARYDDLANRAREAFLRRFVSPEGYIVANTQTAYVLALHFDLLPMELRPTALQALVDDVGRSGWHLSTGFVGTPYISRVLSDNGRLDVAYKLLLQESWPSWLYSVTQGATTIWERWDGWTHDKGFQDVGMNSFNHYAYGAIGAWLYAVVAGIDVDEARPGYEHIVLRPRPGGGLTQAKGALASTHGLIESAWKIEDGSWIWEVLVPANCTATAYVPCGDPERVILPEGSALTNVANGEVQVELPSGSHRFEVKDWA